MSNFSISYIYQIKDQMGPTLKRITRDIKTQNDSLTMQQRIWTRLVITQAKFSAAVKNSRNQVDKLKGDIKNSVGDIVGIGASFASIGFPIKKAMAFEDAMTGVAKAANLDKGTKQYKEMSDTIRKMAKEMPKSHEEIAAMFEAGARLGIDAKDLPDFARLTAKTSVAFDMMAETAGDSLASIGAKMGIPIEGMESMMDAVNTLENNTASKGKEMINIIGRIAGTAKSIELKPEQTAGLASFANQITVSPELAASGINMMINRMQKVPILQKQLLKSPEKAVHNMLKSLAKIDKGKRANVITKIFGDDAGRFVTQAVGSLDLYEKTMAHVADKTKFAGSMNAEYEAAMMTTSAQVTMAGNALNDLAISIGSKLLPFTILVTQAISGLASGIQIVVDNTGPVIPMLAAFATTLATVAAITKVWTIAQLALNVAFAASPFGLIVAGLSAVAALAAWCYQKFEAFRNVVDDVWASVKGFFGFTNDEGDMSVKLEKSAEVLDKRGKMAIGDAARGGNVPNGNVDISVAGTNAQVTGMSMSGQGLTNKGMVEFSSLMN